MCVSSIDLECEGKHAPKQGITSDQNSRRCAPDTWLSLYQEGESKASALMGGQGEETVVAGSLEKDPGGEARGSGCFQQTWKKDFMMRAG